MKKSLSILALIVGAQLAFTGCSDNAPTNGNTDEDSSALSSNVLTNISVNVITETYSDLYQKASEMNSIAEEITVGNDAKLQELKEAWQNTRAPWEKSEGFLYGPVDTQGIDPSIDSWPVDVNAINNILSSDNEITPELLESNNEARGFHTIEYFIWGLDGNKPAGDLTERQIEYLQAATQNLKQKTQQLYSGWLSSEDNYAANFINAGETGSIYSSQKAALEEMAEGMAAIADEVANGKIETPLNGNNGEAKPEAEESRFSNNSKLDFANNIRSIQNIYLGDYSDSQGKGLTDIVSKTNPELDNRVKIAITDAIQAIEAIPGTFTDAIISNRSQVESAQNKVAVLFQILHSEVSPFISSI